MTKFARIDVTVMMRESGVIPLYYNSDVEVCKKVIRACHQGGMNIFEFTNRGDFAHEVFGQLVKWAAKEIPDMILGVGSIVDAGTCSLFIQQGASFIVSPLLNEDMAKVCNRRKISWVPGCATISEISKAEELGAEVVKIYPASTVGGPDFIKAILGPCPWSQLMPSGGVDGTEENLRSWFSAGAFCVGMGSNLITKDIVKGEKYDLLSKNVSEIISIVGKIRNQI